MDKSVDFLMAIDIYDRYAVVVDPAQTTPAAAIARAAPDAAHGTAVATLTAPVSHA
jgi:hypothetical protein